MADVLSRPESAPAEVEREGPLYEVTDTGNSSMKVVVRVRPESEAELRSSCQCVVKVLDEHVLLFDPAASAGGTASGKDDPAKKFSSPSVSRFFGGRRLRPLLAKKHKDLRFAFDRVFDETSSQMEVFRHTADSVLDGVLDGINCSIFAYGATGAGKTYTMLGGPEDPGVIFHTMMELYRRIDAIKNTKTCHVKVSYCEVYNESIRDLLVPSGTLSLREDAQKGLVVSGLSCHTPQTAEEILGMLEQGNNNRTQHPTEANATSSRSHAVFQVFVEQKPRTASLSAEVTQAKMSLIDLAGSERATVTSNRGARLREGANINRSLLALGNCINALASNKGKSGYVPYRDSKLTRLLKDSLGGNCRTVMVANISPSALCYEDTYNTLKYADRAKQIKTSLVRNVLHVDYHMTKYRAIIQDLRKEISELKMQVGQAGPVQETFDPAEANRLCEMVSGVYAQRGRFRKHMADLDAKEREALLKVYRKERDLKRIDALSGNEAKKLKVKCRLESLRLHVNEIQRQKQTINEYLYSNNESVGRVQGEVNAACRAETGGTALQRLLEAVTEARKLDVENSHQWKQTKHLLKYIKNQEREIAKTERMLCLALSLVQRQEQLLRTSSVDTATLQDDLDSLTHLADGDKGVAWADQTRISTNDLQDVNVSNFSLTQQQLFDCFLEHSSPRVRGGIVRKDSPQLFPSSLSILTSTTTNPSHKEELDGKATPTHLRCSSQLSSARTTPTSPPPTTRVSSSGTVTVRASHTISSHTSPHGKTDSTAPGGGSVTVTTDVRISSDIGGSDPDDISDVSASSGVTGSYSLTSEPTHSDALDYDMLEKQSPRTTPTRTSSKLTVAERTRTPAFDISKIPHPSTPNRTLYGPRSLATPYLSGHTSQIRPPVGVAPAPQPYSMFQPFQQRPPVRSASSSHIATPPDSDATPLTTSHQSVSTEAGVGRVTSLPGQSGQTGQTGQLPRARGQMLIPNRPMANGFMVRSNPSSYYSSGGQLYPSNRLSGFEDNFVSPPLVQQRRSSEPCSPYCASTGIIKPQSGTMKAPIGARLKSPFTASLSSPFVPRQPTATPNPYVKAPAHMPRPPHVYQSITIPGPAHLPQPPPILAANRSDQSGEHSFSTATPDQRSNLSKSTALSGSKCSLVEEPDEDGLNSTFTVEVGVVKSSSAHALKSLDSDNTKKEGVKKVEGGRGIFSRGRSPSKLPSYLKMTKSAESKKVSRVQNKENQGQGVKGQGGQSAKGQGNQNTATTTGLRFRRFNLNRSRDRINTTSNSSAPIALSSRFSSAPQLAW